MTVAAPPAEAELAALRRRLERERRARLEAEAISERGLTELFERQRELRLLQAIASTANESSELEPALRLTLEQVCAHTGFSVGHAFLVLEGGDDELHSSRLWHISDAARFARLVQESEATSFRYGVGLPGRVASSGRPAWISDLATDPNFPRAQVALESGLRTALALPVLVGASVVAVLEFFSEQHRDPDDALLEVMAHVGTQLGRVAERRASTRRLRHEAMHDPLTGLPNRGLFAERLERALSRSRCPGASLFAVLFLDLDRFKVINDSLGHAAGDQLLVEVAHRLAGCVRSRSVRSPQMEDTIARLGGDEFTLLVEDVRDASDAIRVAERIRDRLAPPFRIDGREVYVTASMGVALSASGYAAAGELLRDADIAMYRAKATGTGRCQLFDRAMHERAVARLQLETDLRRAIERAEFRVHYQPIVSLESGRVTGCEALVRWQHPERGLMAPGEFLWVAEETGLVVAVGQQVLRDALRTVREWRDDGLCDDAFSVSVNLSAREFARLDLTRSIADALHASGLAPAMLRLEITESLAMEDAERTRTMLLELKALGVGVSVDDFGTGFSSLSYLRRFPVDTLKIDRSFVGSMHEDDENFRLVRTILALAHDLGMTVVAEGAETGAQVAQLRALGCEMAQGYVFDRPLAPPKFRQLLEAAPSW